MLNIKFLCTLDKLSFYESTLSTLSRKGNIILKRFLFFGMLAHYFSLISLKEAIVYLICTKTGLSYEEVDTRFSSTECSVKDLKV